MDEHELKIRENARRIAAEYAERGDVKGWFDALYTEAAGDNEHIPWADLKPNKFFRDFAESTGLSGDGRKALVVGCGLGDDAKYLSDLGFKVSAFDISPTAIEWAKKLYGDADIQFEAMDLFHPFRGWVGSFDFVLEVYTIQPLPLEIRPEVIDAIAAFVADGGKLVVVARGRDDDEEPVELPWALSRKDLARFKANGLKELDFRDFFDEEDVPIRRFVVEYQRVAERV